MASGASQLRFRFLIAYDGGNYAGWQTQRGAVTVQETIEVALRNLFPGAGRIHGSSRTDTGVHSMGTVAHVDIDVAEFKMPVIRLAVALNAFLPHDIRILKARRCPARFHARFDARGKQYRYLAWNDRTMNPLLRHQAWHVPQILNVDRIRSAAKLLVGRKDFKSFAATRNYEMKSTIRSLTRCEVQKRGKLLTFVIEGDGFLYKMCRGIAGTLIQVGTGKFSNADIRAMLAATDRRAGGVTAPAHGLVLWKVFY